MTHLQGHGGAPVPEERTYTETETFALESTPHQTELKFQERYHQSEWIPENYLNQFEAMLHSIVEWIGQTVKKNRKEYREFKCPIMYISFISEPPKGAIKMLCVLVRPCAENLGFYKLVLWALRYSVIVYKFKLFKLENVLESNLKILEGMGFRAVWDADMEYTNCLIDDRELMTCSREKWRLSRVLDPEKNVDDDQFFYYNVFPTALELNDQKYVDEKYRRFITRRR
jgi:hypothetical protein